MSNEVETQGQESETVEVAAVAKRKNIPMVEFLTAVCEVHKAGGAAKDIAARLGMDEDSVLTRMSQYRSKGVAVPNFARGGGSRISDTTANDLIASLLEQDADAIKAKGAALKAKAKERAAERAAAKAKAASEETASA